MLNPFNRLLIETARELVTTLTPVEHKTELQQRNYDAALLYLEACFTTHAKIEGRPLWHLKLSQRAHAACVKAGIETVEEALALDGKRFLDLRQVPNCGDVTLREIANAIFRECGRELYPLGEPANSA
jgi:hypothetical protein